jgi:NTE family protein
MDYKHGFILPKSLLQAKKLEYRLRAWTVGSPNDFSKFHIPFRAVATDIATGETVVLSSGDIARSLRASMSVPGVFEPVKIRGKMLIDGGVSDQLPIDIAKKMGADVVIAVNVGTPLETSGMLRSIIDITNQLTGILTNKSVHDVEKLLTERDVLITPDLKDFSNMDFTKGAVEIELGMQAALNVREKL